MSKHSPFPWKRGKYSETSIMAGDRLVANTGGYQSNFEDYLPENVANANLIVKVPEMYDFIKGIAEMFKWYEGTMESVIENAQAIMKGIENG